MRNSSLVRVLHWKKNPLCTCCSCWDSTQQAINEFMCTFSTFSAPSDKAVTSTMEGGVGKMGAGGGHGAFECVGTNHPSAEGDLTGKCSTFLRPCGLSGMGGGHSDRPVWLTPAGGECCQIR